MASATKAAWPMYLHSRPESPRRKSDYTLQFVSPAAATIHVIINVQHQTTRRGMVVPGPMQRDNLYVGARVELMSGGYCSLRTNVDAKLSSFCTILLYGSGKRCQLPCTSRKMHV